MMKKISPVYRCYLSVVAYVIVLFCLIQLMLNLLSTKGFFGHFSFPLAIVVIVAIGLLVVRGVMWIGDRAAATLLPDGEDDKQQ